MIQRNIKNRFVFSANDKIMFNWFIHWLSMYVTDVSSILQLLFYGALHTCV